MHRKQLVVRVVDGVAREQQLKILQSLPFCLQVAAVLVALEIETLAAGPVVQLHLIVAVLGEAYTMHSAIL